MKRGSLHTRSFRRIHFSVFTYSWTKSGFTGPKSFRAFRETGPRLWFPAHVLWQEGNENRYQSFWCAMEARKSKEELKCFLIGKVKQVWAAMNFSIVLYCFILRNAITAVMKKVIPVHVIQFLIDIIGTISAGPIFLCFLQKNWHNHCLVLTCIIKNKLIF